MFPTGRKKANNDLTNAQKRIKIIKETAKFSRSKSKTMKLRINKISVIC